jgi:CRP-like cAMP-binding protein
MMAAYGIACALWTGMSVWLGVFLWERRIGPLVADLWSAEGPLGHFGQALVASVAALIAYAGFRLFLRVVWPLLTSNSALLARRGQALRFRETLALLRGLPFLGSGAEASLVEVAALFRPVRVPPGTNVVIQGEIGDSFFLVKRGTLDVVKDGESVASLGAGSYFGEIALLRRVPRSATVVSQSECDLLVMSGHNFRTRIAHEIETFQRLQSNVELRAELANLPLLDGLGPTEMDLLLTKLELREHTPGESIVTQGDLGDAFYVVRAGEVALELNGEQVGTFGPGYYFGEIALLMDVPRTATVRAAGDEATQTWSVNRGDFADVLARYLGLAPTLMDAGEHRLRTLAS